MKEISVSNFGLLIAYLVPGLTALWGFSYLSPTVKGWLTVTPPDAPTVGGFLYLTIGSLTAGLTVSTIRWAVIDTLHHATGLRAPTVDFLQLRRSAEAYHLLVELKYRYYQFYANMVVALGFLYAARSASDPALTLGALEVAGGVLALVFLAGSRDTLRKYYDRLEQMLRPHDRLNQSRPVSRSPRS